MAGSTRRRPGGRCRGGRSAWLIAVIPTFAALVIGCGNGSDVDLATAVEATGSLDAYRIRVMQQTESVSVVGETLQIGPDASSTVTFNGQTDESRLVDGRLYELDGDMWFLKPAPASSLTSLGNLRDLTAGLLDLPVVEIGRTERTLTMELTCGTAERAELPGPLVQLCDDRVDARMDIDLELGLVVRLEGRGEFEISPDWYEEGVSETSIEPVEPVESVEIPTPVDDSRATCIGDRLGTSDYAEMSVLIDDNTTVENSELYLSCGFELFPGGKDLRD